MKQRMTGTTYGSKDIAERFGVPQERIWQLVFKGALRPDFRTIGKNGKKGHARWTEQSLGRVERVLRKHKNPEPTPTGPQQALPLVVEVKQDTHLIANGVDPIAAQPAATLPDSIRTQIRLIVREELRDTITRCLQHVDVALTRIVEQLKTKVE